MRQWQLLKKYRLFLLMLLLVLLRLPSINRPVSKHHEFNTAVILINAESWQQAGGPEQFSYTPLLNYQGSSNRVLEKGNHIDAKGNHVYLSFGPGWYLIPWFVFNAFDLSFTPLNLRLLSIVIGLITVLLLQRLILQVTADKDAAFAGTVLFAFLPAPLWYCGIGYVTTAVMLPLVIAVLMLWHQFEKSESNISLFRLIALLFLSVCLGYCDWISVFLFGMMTAWAVIKSFKSPAYLWVAVFSFIAVVYPVMLVLWQFSDYLGWQQVAGYWRSRFAERSSAVEGGSIGGMLRSLVINFSSGFLPLAIMLFAYIKNRRQIVSKSKLTWPVWCMAVIIFYNGVFFNWSCIHQFAWMAFGLFAAVFFGVYLLPFLPLKQVNRLVPAVAVVSIIMYFIINPPGPRSFSGEPYNRQRLAGVWISRHVDRNLPIFMFGETDKVIEYYSKRSFTMVPSLQAAQAAAASYGIGQAMYLEIDRGQIKKATLLNAK